ncbi:ABC transporter permease, partial [Salmonella enterica subsp. enterica serovar Typhimurium]|uniref:hypothetical protein n=1 Tax=Salmonella enterica TaxID=28901 RepID=UPI000CB6FFCD
IAPKLTGLVWLYLVYGFIVTYLGGILEFPDWANNLSVFYLTPQIPGEDVNFWGMLLFIATAVVLSILGMIGYSRRDIQ